MNNFPLKLCLVFFFFLQHFLFGVLQGGLKAAINADVIQTVTVIIVSIAVIIKGTIFSGGIKRVYDINRENGK